MTDNPDRYYRSAGAVPFTGILLMMGGGFVAAAICGFLYAAADWYIAFDIVPFLCAPAAGAAIGAAVKGAAMAGGVRNRLFLALVGVAMGAAGAYFSWVFFLRLWDAAGFWVWDPLALMFIINEVSEVGVWENQPTGGWLKLIYGAEALAFIIPSAAVAAMAMRPFCDSCNKWTTEVPDPTVLKLTDPETLREKLEESQYEALDELFDPQVDRSNCLHAKIFACPKCEESNYLAISHVTVVQKGGETHQNEEKLINYLWVPADVVDQLKRLTEAMRQSAVADDVGTAFGGTPAKADEEE